MALVRVRDLPGPSRASGKRSLSARDSVPASGVYVVAIPDAPHRDNEWRYRAELTDQNGRSLLRGIVPGEYRIFSWDSDVDFKTVQLKVIETENTSQARQ